MGEGRHVAEVVGRVCGAEVAVCHTQNQQGEWEAQLDLESVLDPQLARQILERRVVATDGSVYPNLSERVQAGVYLTVHSSPGPMILWLGLEAPPDLDRLGALTEALEWFAARPSDNERQVWHHRRLEAVDRMVSGVAHELNNPLQTVVGNAEMLAGMKLTDSAHRRAQRVLAGARRCQEVVDGLLKLKRKRRGLAKMLVLEEVVRRVARRVEAEFSDQRVTLKLSVVDPVPTVNGDESDLEQALENVVRNAFQAVPSSDAEVEILVDADQGAARVQVTDNGIGMNADVCDRAFEPFFTTRSVGAGKGLGLSIALGIVEEHGGQIDILPREVGIRLVVKLPGL